MMLCDAVTQIANRYGYDAFDNLDKISDPFLQEAVLTVRLARRGDEEIDMEIHRFIEQNRTLEYIAEHIQLSEARTIRHLYRTRAGREYLDRFLNCPVTTGRLLELVKDNRISFIKLMIETNCSITHLKKQLAKYDWGREYLKRHLHELTRKGMRTC